MPRVLLVPLAVILSALFVVTAAPGKPAKPKPDNPTQTTDPMRIAIVRDDLSNCEPDCTQWIMMQGDIVPASVPLFKRVLKLAGKRKLPVFVNSRGGKVEAGLALGRLIREHHLEVTVNRTFVDSCAANDRTCNDKALIGLKGIPISYTAICASSCAFVLAAGEKRHVPRGVFVGVHQFTNYLTMTRYMNTYERRRAMVNGRMVIVSQKLIKQRVVSQTTTKVATPKSTYDRTARYFAEMGIGDGINTIIQATPRDGIHWLDPDELSATNLMSDRLDGFEQTVVLDRERIAAAAKPVAPIVTSLGTPGVATPAAKVDPPPPTASVISLGTPGSAAPAAPPPESGTPAATLAPQPGVVPARTKTYVSADSDIPLGRYRGADVMVDVTFHQRLGTPTIIVDFTPRGATGPIQTTNLIATLQVGDRPPHESAPIITAGSFQSLAMAVPVGEFCTLRQTDTLSLGLKAGPGGEFEEGRMVLQTESRFESAHALLAEVCGQAQAAK